MGNWLGHQSEGIICQGVRLGALAVALLRAGPAARAGW